MSGNFCSITQVAKPNKCYQALKYASSNEMFTPFMRKKRAGGNFIYFHFESIRSSHVSRPCSIKEQTMRMSPRSSSAETSCSARALLTFIFRRCSQVVNEKIYKCHSQYNIGEWDLDTYRSKVQTAV